MATRTKSRKKVRQQQQRRQQIIVGAVVTVVVVAGIAAFLLLNAPPPTVERSRLELDPVLGDPNAPVTIVKYGAYSCHGCQALHESGTIERILNEYDGHVNFTFRDFPFIMPTYDHMAAEVAQCVLDQDQESFWQFHDLLYTEFYANSTRAELVDIAADRTDVNRDEMRTCVNTETHYQTVQFDADRGLRLGIRATPTLYVNNAPVFSPTMDNLRAAIEDALRS